MSFRYNVEGGVSPVFYSKLSGDLPTGLTLNADGTVTGVAMAAGEYSWVVKVVDSIGLTATLPDTCTITSPIYDLYAYRRTPSNPGMVHVDLTTGSSVFLPSGLSSDSSSQGSVVLYSNKIYSVQRANPATSLLITDTTNNIVSSFNFTADIPGGTTGVIAFDDIIVNQLTGEAVLLGRAGVSPANLEDYRVYIVHIDLPTLTVINATYVTGSFTFPNTEAGRSAMDIVRNCAYLSISQNNIGAAGQHGILRYDMATHALTVLLTSSTPYDNTNYVQHCVCDAANNIVYIQSSGGFVSRPTLIAADATSGNILYVYESPSNLEELTTDITNFNRAISNTGVVLFGGMYNFNTNLDTRVYKAEPEGSAFVPMATPYRVTHILYSSLEDLWYCTTNVNRVIAIDSSGTIVKDIAVTISTTANNHSNILELTEQGRTLLIFDGNTIRKIDTTTNTVSAISGGGISSVYAGVGHIV